MNDGLLYFIINEMQRVHILANRARRKNHFEALIADTRTQLTDHASGKKLLETSELDFFESKLLDYQRKLEAMEGDMDEREVKQVLKREKMRFARDAQRRHHRER